MTDSDAAGQEHNNAPDWQPDVRAVLKNRGLSHATVSRKNGYHVTVAGKALKRSWQAMEDRCRKMPNRYKFRPTVPVSENVGIKKI
jgi:hypothetical protein